VRHLESRGDGALVRHLIKTTHSKKNCSEETVPAVSPPSQRSALSRSIHVEGSQHAYGSGLAMFLSLAKNLLFCSPIRPVEIFQFRPTDAQSSSAIDPNEWTGPLGQHPTSQAKQLNRRRGTGERERNTRPVKEKKSLDWFEGLLFGYTRGTE
jgi:hypothetical protein